MNITTVGIDLAKLLFQVEFPGFSGHLKMGSPRALGESHGQANECREGVEGRSVR